MRQTFPMRNTFTFESGIRVTSEFEAGNLWRCHEIAPESANEIEPAEDEDENEEIEEVKTASQSTSATARDENAAGNDSDPENKYSITDTLTLFAPTEDDLFCFDLYVCPDSLPYTEGVKQRAQFYFAVTGLP